jgi:hypothetical protein
MELQMRFNSRGYCFAENIEEMAKPVYLVLEEYIELIDDEGEWVTQKQGQNLRVNISLDEAYELIKQVEIAIAEAKAKSDRIIA